MKTIRKTILILIASSVLALMMTGCGSTRSKEGVQIQKDGWF